MPVYDHRLLLVDEVQVLHALGDVDHPRQRVEARVDALLEVEHLLVDLRWEQQKRGVSDWYARTAAA